MYASSTEGPAGVASSEKLQRTTNELRKFYETLSVMDFYSKLDFRSTTEDVIVQ